MLIWSGRKTRLKASVGHSRKPFVKAFIKKKSGTRKVADDRHSTAKVALSAVMGSQHVHPGASARCSRYRMRAKRSWYAHVFQYYILYNHCLTCSVRNYYLINNNKKTRLFINCLKNPYHDFTTRNALVTGHLSCPPTTIRSVNGELDGH